MESWRWSFANFGLWTLDFGLLPQPRLQILLATFLRLEVFRDEDDGTIGKFPLQQRGEKRLRGGGDAGKSQHSTLLHALREGLHSGSFQNVSEQVAGR